MGRARRKATTVEGFHMAIMQCYCTAKVSLQILVLPFAFMLAPLVVGTIHLVFHPSLACMLLCVSGFASSLSAP